MNRLLSSSALSLAAVLLAFPVLAQPAPAPSSQAAPSGQEPAAAVAGTEGQALAPKLRDIGAEGSSSPATPPAVPQDSSPYPNNQVSSAPYISPNGGEEGLKASVRALQNTLTELQALQLQTKQAHWNVSGPFFYPLHEQLDEQHTAWGKMADLVAERLLAIGVSSDGRATTIVQTSSLPEFPGGFIDDGEVVRWFTLAYKQVGEEVRGAIRASEENDPETSNILQEVEGQLAKYQWMMRAYVQTTPTDANNAQPLNTGRSIDLPASREPVQLNGANTGDTRSDAAPKAAPPQPGMPKPGMPKPNTPPAPRP
ncbi:Dps family protein [Aureimonas ureilytica]|uniref:Dps family protein n=1 Tax=Aureimonas ureilytica TaxID=401562 RepID=UPI0009E7CDA7|nr:DNA starvation/stationary phase protection protein [Aureimonas ureilytica]